MSHPAGIGFRSGLASAPRFPPSSSSPPSEFQSSHIIAVNMYLHAMHSLTISTPSDIQGQATLAAADVVHQRHHLAAVP